MKTLSVVVPVYYNERSLPELFEELLDVERQLAERDLGLELIFVDDGSGDGSYAELLRIQEKRPATRLIKLTRNFGGVHAVKMGFQLVTGDCFMMLAADLQDPPAMILTMADHWLAGSKYTVCARAARKDPLAKRLFATIYYHLLRLFVARDYPATGYDLALMDRVMLTHLQTSAKNINTPLFAYWLGFKPTVLTYERRERRHGKGRWTFVKSFKFMLDSLLGFSIVPIRLISFVGLIVSLLSFTYGAVVIVSVMRGGSIVRGWASTAALVSFLLGLIIIMLGVIGEYIWRIFDEVSKRPEAVIEEIR
ncbi:MAG: glycosyltransferase family 2 protein [Gemmatimonas sp.]